MSVLAEVCEAGARVRLHTRYLIVESGDHDWQAFSVESLLEVARHIVSDLANAVQRRISDLGVGVLDVLQHSWDHRSDLFNVVNILTDLGECHNTSMLVSPVCVVSNSVRYEDSNEREHDSLADARNEPINAGLAKADVVFFFLFAGEALLGSEPVSINVLINVDHELEDKLKHVSDQNFVFFGERRLSLDHCDHELERLMTDRIVSKILVLHNWLEGLVKTLEVDAEEVWLDLCKLIELNEGVLKNGLILFVESLGYDLSHHWQESDKVLCVLALSNGQVVRQGLERSKLDVQLLELKRPLKDACKVVLVLYQMVHNVAEEPIEDQEGGVNLRLDIPLNERKHLVKQFLPNAAVLFLDHGALHLYRDIANFVNHSLVCSVNAL